jgi:hypothetical protein
MAMAWSLARSGYPCPPRAESSQLFQDRVSTDTSAASAYLRAVSCPKVNYDSGRINPLYRVFDMVKRCGINQDSRVWVVFKIVRRTNVLYTKCSAIPECPHADQQLCESLPDAVWVLRTACILPSVHVSTI